MANILFFVHKKNFDLLFCRYLRLFHKVSLITSDPMIGLFLNAQDEEVEKLYELTPLQNNILLMSLQKEALMETQLYTVTSDPQKKEALENLCSAYLQCMHELVCQKRIDLIVTHDSVFLDVACISSIANFHNLPVCYLGSGLFRGETITVSSERMYINNPDIWNSRWQNTTRRPLIVHQLLGEVKYDPGYIKKSSQISLLWQKIKYQRNPFWVSSHPDLGPSRTLLQDLKHKESKKKGRSLPEESGIILPQKFILLPLQGNEICKEVSNPLGIKDMEHLTEIVATALDQLNQKKNDSWRLVVKTHPNRPAVISSSFKKKIPDVLFLNKYSIEKLFSESQLLITFNSLAGFEALLQYKPVITLGPTFFALPELVSPLQDVKSLPEIIEKAVLSGCNRSAVDKFVGFLKDHYEIECPAFSRKNPTVDMFKRIHGKIEAMLEFSRQNPSSPGVWPQEVSGI